MPCSEHASLQLCHCLPGTGRMPGVGGSCCSLGSSGQKRRSATSQRAPLQRSPGGGLRVLVLGGGWGADSAEGRVAESHRQCSYSWVTAPNATPRAPLSALPCPAPAAARCPPTHSPPGDAGHVLVVPPRVGPQAEAHRQAAVLLHGVRYKVGVPRLRLGGIPPVAELPGLCLSQG